MDFSNIAGMYSDKYSTAANQTASRLENKLTDADYSKATDAELMDACRQFEAYFVEQMFKAMQRMVPESEEDVSASTRQLKDYYKEQMTQSFAEQATEGEGLGIAQILYDQMKRNYGLE